jgi:TATA-binding-like protein domain of the TOTE conflict systems/AAA domain/UvrD-like helicase C-terminal domain
MSIFNHFQHINLTGDQNNALAKIQDFLTSDENVFILQGYAGSGKTTLLKGLVDYFLAIEQKYQLMAPTGRAAKVINQKTGFEATTIHKGIYSFDELEEIEIKKEEKSDVSFIYYYKLRNNTEAYNTIFLVDEASMVSDIQSQGEFFRFGSGHLLKDLIEYSHISFPNSISKIIFIGDPAQLPPIGMNFSPALDKKYLNEKYNLRIVNTEIREVKRQDADNGILNSATKIRKCLTSGFFNDFDLRENGRDIFNPKFEDFLNTYKSQQGTKVIISFKNKTALDLNQTIRRDRFGADLTVQLSDIIIVGGNNYRLGIMNGEFGVVSNVETNIITREVRFYRKNGGTASVLLTWRQIELLMPDKKGQSKTVNGYMLENYLNGDNYLKPEEQQALYVDFKNRNPKLKQKTEEFKEAIKTDPYFNCILLKYGYAVTCHKAQGGEWDTTFVFWDKGVKEDFNFCNSEHNRSGKTNPEFYRWAYTAITRASKKLLCINPPCFNSFSGMSFIDVNVQNSFQELTGKSVKPIEMVITGDNLKLLQKFNLESATVSFQNHFLLLNYVVQKQYIDIASWNKVSYEIRYGFNRENETASFKFWINGKNEFKANFQKLPAETNSDSLFELISKLIETAPKIVFVRNTVDTILSKIEFEFEIEEEKPFLKTLFDSLQSVLADSSISITEINHQNYRERYTFEKADEKAVIDFEYNGNGFFGRVLPLENQCTSGSILNTIRQAISNLKFFDYVV